jgi:hypothetical protein
MRVEVLSDQAVSPNLAAGAKGVACAFPQATVLADGRLAVVYRRGETKHSQDGVFVFQRSSADRSGWETPIVAFDGRQRQPAQTVVSGGLCQTRQGTIFATFSTVEAMPAGMYMFSAEGMALKRRVFAIRSEDGGQTWSDAVLVDTRPYELVGITTKPFILPDGRIFAPIEIGTPAGVQSSFAVISKDDGRTFGPLITCADDKSARLSLCDARYTVLADGRLLMLLWTFRREDEETIEVHQSYSADGGQTWTPAQSIGILGQITVPLALPGGAVIAASNYRLTPEGSRLWYSPDGGANWDTEHPIQMWDARQTRILGESVAAVVERQKAGDSIWQALGGFTFGTPDLVALPDGSVVLTYYATLQDIIHVRACRFRVQAGG